MAWPLSQDYNEAIQHPASCFSDPELRAGQPVTNALGLPEPCSGNFADVYQISSGSKSWAVKCFTRQIPGLQERYVHISMHLQSMQLPFIVGFTFLEQGIRVSDRWYPIVKMDWVEGLTLNAFVRACLDQPHTLEVLAGLWVKLAQRLREADVAHCDLQHGNVLLVPGSKANSLKIKLVDYDGMCVPALKALKPIEVGHPNYQHPQRLREALYGPEVDRFSHLVIYTALRALAVGGKALWDRYDNGDNLLFKQADFEAPAESPVLQELIRSGDPEVCQLARALAAAAEKPLDQTPLLEELVVMSPGPQWIAPAEPKEQVKATPAETAESPKDWWTDSPPVRQAAPMSAAAESVFAQMTADRLDADEPAKGRDRSRLALIVGAVLLGLGCLSVGAVLLSVSRNKPPIPGPVAKGRTGPSLAESSGLPAESDGDTAPGTKAKSGPARPTEPREKGKDIKPITKPGGDTQPGTSMDAKPKNAVPNTSSPVAKGKTNPKTAPEPPPNTWTTVASMPTARSLLATVTGLDGRIYAIGGANASGRLDTVEAYDPSTNTWAKVASMPTVRHHLAATVAPDGRIYVIGGHSSIPKIVEAYNRSTSKWTTVASTPTARYGLAAVTGPDGRIYAIGGTGPAGVSVTTVEAYDTKTNTWTTVASMPTARTYLAAATGLDGRIYAIGGFVEKDGKRLATVEAYDTNTNKWTTVASMPTARNALAAATGRDGRIYAIGGHPEGGNLNPVEAYNPSTNKWTTVASMSTVRGELAATTGRDGCIYAIGGGGGNVRFLNTVEALSFSPSK